MKLAAFDIIGDMVSINAASLRTYTTYKAELFIREFRMGNDVSSFYCFDEISDPLSVSNKVSFLKEEAYAEFSKPNFRSALRNSVTGDSHVIKKDDYSSDGNLIFERFYVDFQVSIN